MHSLMIPCSFALLLLPLLLFADAHSENLIEQAIIPVGQPFDNNNTLIGSLDADSSIETEIIAAEYSYLMKLRVTTSGDDNFIETYATLDTGSNLIWLNAKGCSGDACHCSFENSKSKTTKQQYCIEEPKQPHLITCEDDRYCKELERLRIKTCSSGFCGYNEKFPDKLETNGTLGIGNFSFQIIDDKKRLNRSIKFGVSKESKGRLAQKSVGVVGLGRGSLSLLKQLSIERKFSYCLPNPQKPKLKGKIKFGKKVATSAKFTSLLHKKGDECEDRYCVHLASFSVGEVKTKVSEKTNIKVMAIDSGSTFTYLVPELFKDFFDKVKNAIGEEHVPIKVNDYDNCFEKSAVSANKLEEVSFEFGDGGGSGTTKIELKQDNFFDDTSYGGKTYLCLTVVDGGMVVDEEKKKLINNIHLLGNRAQMGFWVAFDLSNEKDMKVSFGDMENCAEKKNFLPVLSE